MATPHKVGILDENLNPFGNTNPFPMRLVATDYVAGQSGIDPSTEAIYTVPYEHHELHSGNHFFYQDVLSLGNAATQNYLITTPDTTKWGHLLYNVTGTIGVIVGIYEGADRVGTTLQATYNNNRNSPTTAGITIHKGHSAGTTDGTNIAPNGFGSGTAGGSGGTINRENEIILKQNTKYIFRVTNKGTTTNEVSVKFVWYEHTNKN